ncbi:nitrite reductase large subunit NirB [Propionibacterium cyclohexanicum]|nr:nitrite reductase large subunit NirB [Propionibacterium cyclohexanicum]
MRSTVVVAGAGMVAQHFVETLVAQGGLEHWRVEVFGEESREPYDRVALTSFFHASSPDELVLGERSLWHTEGVDLHLGSRIVQVDPTAHLVRTSDGGEHHYDKLVLATGSYAAKPPVPGNDMAGCFVYRTIDDVCALRDWVREHERRLDRTVRGAVVGGGLLGLEAAGALHGMGVETTVVEFADRLMPLQVDQAGGQALVRMIEQLGVQVRTSTASKQLLGDDTGVTRMEFADGSGLDVDVVVFATGVRPRDELARQAGLDVHPRGGVLAGEDCATSDPDIVAIGEVACIAGRVWGLVAPGNEMAEVAASRLLGGDATFTGADLSTKLKLLGVDVASFGDAFAKTEHALEVVYSDPLAKVYKKLVLSDDASVLLGGILVGDASDYAALRLGVGRPLGCDPAAWLVPGGAERPGAVDLPDDAKVCSCNNVSAGTIRTAVVDGATDLAAVKKCTRAGTTCGSCIPLVKKILDAQLLSMGVEVSNALCEHFDHSRAELFEIVRASGITTFSELISRYGTGLGCDICRPTVASIFSSLGRGQLLDGENAALQDTNDHFLANMQKDGSYSVVPRVPGGEITPAGLIAIGQIASDFDLYTKITGGQRIDLLGARLEQLPLIWQRLLDAGFECGHAYGKAMRTVKSCVGASWCRYGVQDSTSMAIRLENRYRGVRSPHKLKLGVSGCARECAEAQAKDIGVIATEKGWNLYVCGNGGFTPVHAQLLAEDLDDERLVTLIDRFIIFYIRTADRLQRTAPWLQALPGGLEHLKEVIVDDSLGLAADLEAAMAAHVAGYRDEWADALHDPRKRAMFTSFLNAPGTPDPDLRYLVERGQRRPDGPFPPSAIAAADATAGGESGGEGLVAAGPPAPMAHAQGGMQR